MNIYKSIAYKNLSKNKKRTYTTIVGIILAVALICFIITIVYSLKKSMINAIKSTIGNYHINIQNISMSELLDIKEINNLIKIENFGISQTIGGATYETKNLSKQGILIEGYDNIALKNRDLHLLEGTLPKSENEILVSDYFISNTNEKITVGSKITLNVEKAKLNVKNKNKRIIEQAGEEKITYTIVGIINQTSKEVYNANAYIAITKLNVVANERPCNITVLLQNSKQINDFYNILESKNSYFEISENSELLLWQGASNEFNEKMQLELIVTFTIFIILAISITLIKNSFYISVCERIKEFETLISIGATTKQIKKIVLYEALFYAIISIPIGIIIGTGTVFLGISSINNILEINNLQIQFSTSAIPITISGILMILVIFISCIKPLKQASKVSPIEGIRQNNQIFINKNKKQFFNEKKIGIEAQIAYKNLKRNKLQYRATTILICIIILLIFIINNMVQYIINQCQSFSPSNYNIDISIIHGKESYSSQLEYYEKIKQLNSIKEYSIFANFKGIINGKEISIIACEGKVFDKYLENLELKKSDISSSGIIINDNSNITQFKQEDILPVIVNEKEYNIPIIKITNNSPWDAVQTLDISKIRNTNNTTLILSIDMAKNINFEQKGISISSSIGMKINAEKPKEIEKEILKIIKSKNTIVTNYQRINENNQRIIFIVHAFIYGILIAVSVICIANIYNTILANMNLRNREFAILQSIGMEQKQLRKMFFYESVLYTIKALIIGTIVGFITTFIIYLVLNDSTLVYNFPIYHILFASVFIFAIIIMITNINYKKVSNSSSVNRVIKQQGT